MAYARRRTSRYRARSAPARRRETFSARRYGRFGLTTANQAIQPLDLLSPYQAGAVSSRDVERATIRSITGWVTWASFSGTDSTITLDNRIWFATRVLDGVTATQGFNDLAERLAQAPYTSTADAGGALAPDYQDLQWRMSRPVVPVDDATGSHDTAAWQMRMNRTPISIRQMRKLHSVNQSIYLVAGLNFDPTSGGDVEVRYDLTIHGMRP